MDLTLKERIRKVEDCLYGNGKDGLLTEIALVKQKQETMTEDLGKLATAYSALAKSQTERDAIQKHRGVVAKSIGLYVSIVAGILGALFLVLEHIG